MSVRTFLRAVALAWPLILAITLYAYASDRESGPAGAAGIGRPGGAYSDYGPAQNPVKNVSGNAEFTRPERVKPSVREARGTTDPHARESSIVDQSLMDTGN